MVTALRSFFRDLRLRGDLATDLAGCVPTLPDWRLATLPKGLDRKDLRRLVNIRRRPAGVTVIIAADRAVPWKAVVAALDAATDGGADKLEFAKSDEAESRGVESRPSSSS